MTPRDTKRGLLLAGGGIKVAYQAGCLQVLLDEAKLQFDHVDAASGGCLNAAMLFSGQSGTQIADNWRQTNPFDMVAFNLREYRKLFWARSIALLDPLKEKVFPKWGLDWDRIRSHGSMVGTFNIYDFTNKRLQVFENTEMDADLLCASVALPMWFPPLERDGRTLFDAVFATDCNVGEAVRRGADELWCIWTVARKPDYRDGFLAQYFHIVETCSNTRFESEWNEVEQVNRLIERAGGPDMSRTTQDLMLREGTRLDDPELRPPPGRKPIAQHLIRQEVPLHYLINLSQDRLAEAVELGVRDARQYCYERGLIESVHVPPRKPVTEQPRRLSFSETMRGSYMPGTTDPRALAHDKKNGAHRATLRVTVHIEDLDRFLREPEHQARLTGTLELEGIAEPMPIQDGSFRLFTIADLGHVDAPENRRMEYRLRARGDAGKQYVLEGVKYVENDLGFDSLADLTTLYARVYASEADGSALEPIGAALLHIRPLDFLRQLASFRVPGAEGPAESLSALARFGKYFAGRAWDVYARRIVDYAPL